MNKDMKVYITIFHYKKISESSVFVHINNCPDLMFTLHELFTEQSTS